MRQFYLKEPFFSSPILLPPKLHKPFILSTDYSGTTMCFCLHQEKNDILHPVSYGSKRLTDSECHLNTIKKRAVSNGTVILKDSRFLMGSHFIIEVDHKPIEYAQTKAICNPIILQILLQIQ